MNIYALAGGQSRSAERQPRMKRIKINCFNESYECGWIMGADFVANLLHFVTDMLPF